MEQKILREMWLNYGAGFALDPKRLRAYLLDMQVQKKWIHLLVSLSELPYFKDFIHEVLEDLSAREKLVYAAEEAYPFDRAAREFGADCWTYALTGMDFASFHQEQLAEEKKLEADEGIKALQPEKKKAQPAQESEELEEEIDPLCGRNTAKRLALQGERDRAAFMADLKDGKVSGEIIARLPKASGNSGASDAGVSAKLSDSEAKGLADVLRSLLAEDVGETMEEEED